MFSNFSLYLWYAIDNHKCIEYMIKANTHLAALCCRRIFNDVVDDVRQTRGTKERKPKSGWVAAVQGDHQLLSHVSSTLITSLSFDAHSRNPHTVHKDYPTTRVYSSFSLSLSFFRVSLVTFLRAFAVAHARTRTHKRKQKPPSRTLFTLHRAIEPRSISFLSSSFPLVFPLFLPIYELPTTHCTSTMNCSSDIGTIRRNATPALFVIPPRKRAHFVPVPARTAAASR